MLCTMTRSALSRSSSPSMSSVSRSASAALLSRARMSRSRSVSLVMGCLRNLLRVVFFQHGAGHILEACCTDYRRLLAGTLPIGVAGELDAAREIEGLVLGIVIGRHPRCRAVA